MGSVYRRGCDAWVLGVEDTSGTSLNDREGTLPRINGHKSLEAQATDIYPAIFDSVMDGSARLPFSV